MPLDAQGIEVPTLKELAERVAKIEARKDIALGDLPMAALKSKLEQTWQPNGGVLLEPGSVGIDSTSSEVARGVRSDGARAQVGQPYVHDALIACNGVGGASIAWTYNPPTITQTGYYVLAWSQTAYTAVAGLRGFDLQLNGAYLASTMFYFNLVNTHMTFPTRAVLAYLAKGATPQFRGVTGANVTTGTDDYASLSFFGLGGVAQ